MKTLVLATLILTGCATSVTDSQYDQAQVECGNWLLQSVRVHKSYIYAECADGETYIVKEKETE